MDGNQELELYELLAAFRDAAGGHDTVMQLTAMHGAGAVLLQNTAAGASLTAARSTRALRLRKRQAAIVPVDSISPG